MYDHEIRNTKKIHNRHPKPIIKPKISLEVFPNEPDTILKELCIVRPKRNPDGSGDVASPRFLQMRNIPLTQKSESKTV